MRKVNYISIVIVAIILSAGTVWAWEGWQSHVLVDAPSFSEWNPSHALAALPDGSIFIAFGGDHLYTATGPAEGPWTIRLAIDEDNVGSNTTLALSDDGNYFHSAFRDEVNKTLRYYGGYLNGSHYMEMLVDDSADVGKYSSIAIHGGYTYIAYADQTNYTLNLAKRTDGPWTTEIVKTGAGGANSIGVASDGTIYIATQDYSAPGLSAVWFDGAWYSALVDSSPGAGTYTGLVMGPDDHPYIVYRDSSAQSLKLAYYDGSNWHVQTVDDSANVGEWPSCVFDSDDNLAIAYFDANAGDLKLAIGDPVAETWDYWTLEEPMWVGFQTNIALLPDGRLVLAYLMGTLEMIKIGVFDPSDESFSSEMLVWKGDSGASSDITMSSTGYLHLAWNDILQATVSVGIISNVTESSFDFSSTVVAANENGMDYITVVSQDGNPAVLYYDMDTLTLKAAMPGVDDYVIETVDESGDVGGYASAAVDSDESIHVAYLDWDNDGLKYATNASGAWAAETIEAGGHGYFNSLAVNPADDRPHIAYYDISGEDLKYAWKDGSGVWHTEYVDQADDVGAYASLDFRPDGNPAIAYLDWTSGNVKYAVKDGDDWTTEIVQAGVGTADGEIALDHRADGSAIIGFRSSVYQEVWTYNWFGEWDGGFVSESGQVDSGYSNAAKVDSQDWPFITFYDKGNGDLRYLRFIDFGDDDDTTDDTADDTTDDTTDDSADDAADDTQTDDSVDDDTAADDDTNPPADDDTDITSGGSDDDDDEGGCCGC